MAGTDSFMSVLWNSPARSLSLSLCSYYFFSPLSPLSLSLSLCSYYFFSPLSPSLSLSLCSYYFFSPLSPSLSLSLFPAESLATLASSLLNSSLTPSHVPVLFYMAGIGYHWIKEGSLFSTQFKSGELLLLQVLCDIYHMLYYVLHVSIILKIPCFII